MLKDLTAQLGVVLSKPMLESLERYKEILIDWNQKINLTAIEEPSDIDIKHFADSLTILQYLPKKPLKMIDVGSGAGFPGIPVKIVRNDIEMTLLETVGKKVNFMNEVITKLGLNDINAIHARAEDLANNPDYREKFDVAVGRALASLPTLIEYCLPFVKIGGIFIAMKGSNVDQELGDSKTALSILGGTIEGVNHFNLPTTDMQRTIIIVRKTMTTPQKYPRKAGTPSKQPLI